MRVLCILNCRYIILTTPCKNCCYTVYQHAVCLILLIVAVCSARCSKISDDTSLTSHWALASHVVGMLNCSHPDNIMMC